MALESWSAQQLAEFLAVVSGLPDERSVLLSAVERAAEAFEAEVGAVVRDQALAASIGFSPGQEASAQIVAAAAGRGTTVDVPGAGACPTLVTSFDDTAPSHLVLARSGEEGFSAQEAGLLSAMGRVLSLTLNSLRRLTMLERLNSIQRSISDRAPLNQVLDAITQGAAELLGGEVVGLRLIDPDEPSTTVTVSSVGVTPDQLAAMLRLPRDKGLGGQAVGEDRLVVEDQYGSAPNALPRFAEDGLVAAMAAPVHENGQPVGSLVVASYKEGRRYTKNEQDLLTAFADHASLALNDARTVTALNRALEDAIHQAFHDSLTGLANRALFLDRLDHALDRARRWHGGVTVLFLDIDDFKVFNDSLGHEAGDQLLVEIGRRLQGCIRGVDTAARLGGDEFAVLLEDTDGTLNVGVAAERILNALRRPSMVSGHEVFIGASVGLAMNVAGEGDASELLRNADMAMYRAKSEGKGRYVFYEPAMHATLLRRLELEGELRRALHAGHFALHYQPIVTVGDETLVGVEALVRWEHHSGRRVLPCEFIPVAEETGLIVPLGRWVLQEACRQLHRWQVEALTPQSLYVSVNLSARQIHHDGYAQEVAETIAASGIAPSSLVLEITESVLMSETEATMAKLADVRRLGVRLALDDFGTGYSSLGYLRRFRVDILKIDRSFVQELGSDAEDSSLARAIVQLGETMQLETVAEGVEEARQYERLRDLGCGMAQGYLFARPMPPNDLRSLLDGCGGRLTPPELASSAGHAHGVG